MNSTFNSTTAYEDLVEFNSKIYYISIPTYIFASLYEILFIYLFSKIYVHWYSYQSRKKLEKLRLPSGIKKIISEYISEDETITISVDIEMKNNEMVKETATAKISEVNAYVLATDIRGYMRICKFFIWIGIIIYRTIPLRGRPSGSLSYGQIFFQILNMVHRTDIMAGFVPTKKCHEIKCVNRPARDLLIPIKFIHAFILWLGIIVTLPTLFYYAPASLFMETITIGIIFFTSFLIERRLISGSTKLSEFKWRNEIIHINLFLPTLLADMTLGIGKFGWRNEVLYHYQLKYARGFRIEDLLVII